MFDSPPDGVSLVDQMWCLADNCHALLGFHEMKRFTIETLRNHSYYKIVIWRLNQITGQHSDELARWSPGAMRVVAPVGRAWTNPDPENLGYLFALTNATAIALLNEIGEVRNRPQSGYSPYAIPLLHSLGLSPSPTPGSRDVKQIEGALAQFGWAE